MNKEKKKKKAIIDISILKSIHLSIDSVEPKNLNLQIEVVSAYSHHHHKTNIQNNPNNIEKAKSESLDSDDEFEKAATIIIAEKKKNKMSLKRLSIRSLANGKLAIKSAISLGANPAKNLSHTFVVVKTINVTHTTKNSYGKHPVWGESVYIDLNQNDFEMLTEKKSNSKSDNINEINDNKKNLNKIDNHDNDKNNHGHNHDDATSSPTDDGYSGAGFQIFLYRGVSGMEYLVGYQFVPYSLLLPYKSTNNDIAGERSSVRNDSTNNVNKKKNDKNIDGNQHNSKIKHHDHEHEHVVDVSVVKEKDDHPRINRASSDASVSTESYSLSGSGASSFINSELGSSKNELQIALNDPRLGKKHYEKFKKSTVLVINSKIIRN